MSTTFSVARKILLSTCGTVSFNAAISFLVSSLLELDVPSSAQLEQLSVNLQAHCQIAACRELHQSLSIDLKG